MTKRIISCDDGTASEADEFNDEDSDGESEDGDTSDDEEYHQIGNGDDQSCPICLNDFIEQHIGLPNNCRHVFCVDCILEWSKNANSCPVDRIEFQSVKVYKRFGGGFFRELTVKGKACANEDDLISGCEICGSGDNEDSLLLCDGCDKAFHCACLQPPLDAVPAGEWFCPSCLSIRSNRSTVSSHPRLVGRTNLSERVRIRISQTRRRHAEVHTSLDEQLDAIVNEILVNAGERLWDAASPTRRSVSSRSNRKRSVKRSKSGRRKKRRRRKCKSRKRTSGKKGGFSLKTQASSLQDTPAFLPLSLTGEADELVEYRDEASSREPSYLIAQKHRLLSQSAIRFNTPLPSLLTFGNEPSRQREPSPPVPDVLSSIFSSQERLLAPSSTITIQRGGGLVLNSRKKISHTFKRSCNKDDESSVNKTKNQPKLNNCAGSPSQNQKVSSSQGQQSTSSDQPNQHPPRSESKDLSQFAQRPSGSISGEKNEKSPDIFDLDLEIEKKPKNASRRERKSSNNLTLKKTKISIRPVLDLPKSSLGNRKTSDSKTPYDPFQLLDEEDNLNESLEVYDPFEPTLSDDEEPTSHVIIAANQPPEAPDESPFKKISRKLQQPVFPDETHLDIDQMLESRLDESKQFINVKKKTSSKKLPQSSKPTKSDIVDDLDMFAEDEVEENCKSIQSSDNESKFSDVQQVKLPGFNVKESSVVPIKFKKYSRKIKSAFAAEIKTVRSPEVFQLTETDAISNVTCPGSRPPVFEALSSQTPPRASEAMETSSTNADTQPSSLETSVNATGETADCIDNFEEVKQAADRVDSSSSSEDKKEELKKKKQKSPQKHRQKSRSPSNRKRSKSRKQSRSPKHSSHKSRYSSRRRDQSRSHSPHHHSSKRRHRSRSPHRKQLISSPHRTKHEYDSRTTHISKTNTYRKKDSAHQLKEQKPRIRSKRKSPEPVKKMKIPSKDEILAKAKQKYQEKLKRQEKSFPSQSDTKKEKYKESLDVWITETSKKDEACLELSEHIEEDISLELAIHEAMVSRQKSEKKKKKHKEKRYSSPEQAKGSGKKKKKHKKDRFQRCSDYQSDEDSESNRKFRKPKKKKLSSSSTSDDEVPLKRQKHSKKHKHEKLSRKKHGKEKRSYSIDQTTFVKTKTTTKEMEHSVVESSSEVDDDIKQKQSRKSNKKRRISEINDAPSHQQFIEPTVKEDTVISDNATSDVEIVGTSLESIQAAHNKRHGDPTKHEIGVMGDSSVTQSSRDSTTMSKDGLLTVQSGNVIEKVTDDAQCLVTKVNESKAAVKESEPSPYLNLLYGGDKISDVDMKAESSPQVTSQPMSEDSDLDIDDLLEKPFQQPVKESTKVDIKSDCESYSVHSAELNDVPKDDMRSPSPLSPSLLSPSSSPSDSVMGSQNSSMIASSQEFKETPSYAEKFLEQSRKRWENSLRNKSPHIPTTQTPDDNSVTETVKEIEHDEETSSQLQKRELEQGDDDVSDALSQTNDKETAKESIEKDSDVSLNQTADVEPRDAFLASNMTKKEKIEPSSLKQSSSYETVINLEEPFEATNADNNPSKDALHVAGNPSKDTDMRTFMHKFPTANDTRSGTLNVPSQSADSDRTVTAKEELVLDINLSKDDLSSQMYSSNQSEKSPIIDKSRESESSHHFRSRSKSSDHKQKHDHESSSISPSKKQISSQRKSSQSRERRRSHHEKHRKSSPKLHLPKHSSEKIQSGHQLDLSHLKSPKKELLSKFLEKTVESMQNTINRDSPSEFSPQPHPTISEIFAIDSISASNAKSTFPLPSPTSKPTFAVVPTNDRSAPSNGDASLKSKITTEPKPKSKSPSSLDRRDATSTKEQDESALYSPSCPISPVSLDEEDAVPPPPSKAEETTANTNAVSLFTKLLNLPQNANNDVKNDEQSKGNSKELENTLNPSEILNIVGLKPQGDAKDAIISIAELSKQLQLGQVLSKEKKMKSSPKRRRSHKEADGLSPANIDNIESSAVALYNRDKKKSQQKKKKFQSKVVAVAKDAIKPHYARREVSKSQYKDIMKRAVNKICSADKTMEVNEVKVRRLIRRYVERYQLKNEKGKERMRKSLDHSVKRKNRGLMLTTNRKELSDSEFLESPPSPEGSPLTAPDSPLEESQEGTPALLKKEPRQVVSLPDLPLPPPPPPPRPRTMM